MVKTAETQLKNLRKQRDRIQAGDLPGPEKRRKTKEIEERMDEIMQRVIDRHREVGRELERAE